MSTRIPDPEDCRAELRRYAIVRAEHEEAGRVLQEALPKLAREARRAGISVTEIGRLTGVHSQAEAAADLTA